MNRTMQRHIEDKKLRGMLTEALKNKAENYLGREFTQKELRLYPFIVYCVINGGRIPREKINEQERKLLHLLMDEGRLKRNCPDYYYPTREFWSFMNDCLADSYVVLAEDVTEQEEGEQ